MSHQTTAILSKTKHILATKTTPQYKSLLKHLKATHFPSKTTQFHAHLITSGLLTVVHSHLLANYAHFGYIHYARNLFDELPQPNTVLYNTMMKMYVNCGSYVDVLKLFAEMLQMGHCSPDNYTYPLIIKACSEPSMLEFGRVVHGHVLVSGFASVLFVMNSLIAMYMNCGKIELGNRVFDAMEERCVVSWNSMISGCVKNGCAGMALMIFDQMLGSGIEIDSATAVCVLPACGHLKELLMGRRVHILVKEKGLGKAIAVGNALVDMYARCGCVIEARLVFDEIVKKDVVSWTSMINGYIFNGDVRKALALCRFMQIEGLRPNSVTITLLLSACASSNNLKDGRCLHGWAIRQKLDSEVIVETSLIDMYAKCNRIDLSFAAFRKTSRKKTVPCNAMISGYTQNGLGVEAIGLFKQMLSEGVKPNDATFSGLLPAYAILADLQPAKNLHCYLFLNGFLSAIEIATSLIDIYSKCGSLEFAYQIFNGIPEGIKDIYAWSVIISSYGIHGHGETAVSLFSQMVLSGIKPNEVTFTSVLHACSHAGLVDEGLSLFKFMINDHQTIPTDDHYACIVDLLSRHGRLDEAYDLIRLMPFVPSHAVWGALLGACVIHENVELGEVAAQWACKLKPEDPGNYVLLAKLYAAVGRWKDAENVRHMMNGIGLRKVPAHSLTDVRSM